MWGKGVPEMEGSSPAVYDLVPLSFRLSWSRDGGRGMIGIRWDSQFQGDQESVSLVTFGSLTERDLFGTLWNSALNVGDREVGWELCRCRCEFRGRQPIFCKCCRPACSPR